MKKLPLSIMIIGFFAAIFVFTSCADDPAYEKAQVDNPNIVQNTGYELVLLDTTPTNVSKPQKVYVNCQPKQIPRFVPTDYEYEGGTRIPTKWKQDGWESVFSCDSMSTVGYNVYSAHLTILKNDGKTEGFPTSILVAENTDFSKEFKLVPVEGGAVRTIRGQATKDIQFQKQQELGEETTWFVLTPRA